MGQDAGVEKVLPDGIDGGRDAHPTICIDHPPYRQEIVYILN